MPLDWGTPPRTRMNDLLDYSAVIAELEAKPGQFARVATQATRSDADKIVRTFRQMGNFNIVTRAGGQPGIDDTRDVWVRILETPHVQAPER